jgi:hypothetical protein
MEIESFEQAHLSVPFHAFSLEMKDGRSLVVPTYKSIAHTVGSRLAILVDARGGCEAVDLSAVASLRFADSTGGR